MIITEETELIIVKGKFIYKLINDKFDEKIINFFRKNNFKFYPLVYDDEKIVIDKLKQKLKYYKMDKLNGTIFDKLIEKNKLSFDQIIEIIEYVKKLIIISGKYNYFNTDLHSGNIMICHEETDTIPDYKNSVIDNRNIYLFDIDDGAFIENDKIFCLEDTLSDIYNYSKDDYNDKENYYQMKDDLERKKIVKRATNFSFSYLLHSLIFLYERIDLEDKNKFYMYLRKNYNDLINVDKILDYLKKYEDVYDSGLMGESYKIVLDCVNLDSDIIFLDFKYLANEFDDYAEYKKIDKFLGIQYKNYVDQGFAKIFDKNNIGDGCLTLGMNPCWCLIIYNKSNSNLLFAHVAWRFIKNDEILYKFFEENSELLIYKIGIWDNQLHNESLENCILKYKDKIIKVINFNIDTNDAHLGIHYSNKNNGTMLINSDPSWYKFKNIWSDQIDHDLKIRLKKLKFD